MILVDAPAQSPIAFAVVRSILAECGLTAMTRSPDLSRSLRLMHPLDRGLADFVRHASTSLTDAATPAEQIRFFQRRRADRAYRQLAEQAVVNRGMVAVRIGNAAELDEPSRDFLRVAARFAGWLVEYDEAGVAASERIVPTLSREESALLEALEDLSDVISRDVVWSAAFDYINAGDAWTAVALGRRLSSAEQSPRVWNLLALGAAMLNKTEEAEFYYDKWRSSGGPLDRVKALYGKAMLYARHHPAGIRDLDESGRLLDEAFALLCSLPSALRQQDDVVFEEVFNRNGFALIEFRRGRVREATSLLESGIARLAGTSEKVAVHRSVLIYNLAQCQRQAGDLVAALETYDRLLEVDPHMPEYWLEAAKCTAAAGQHAEAVAQCRRAIDLDPYVPAAWSLLGLYQGECGRYTDAASAFTEAARLDPDHPSASVDAAYYWLAAHELDEAAHALDRASFPALTADQRERCISLTAELHVRAGRRDRAADILREGLEQYPDSVVLRSNLEAVSG